MELRVSQTVAYPPYFGQPLAMSLEERFNPTFTTLLALREKQIQQEYRPIIGVHKWFARRPGTVFRSLLLAEFNGAEPLQTGYWAGHHLNGVIADPFMGGGTTVYEANRLGFSVVGTDTNPMAYWIVRQSLVPLDAEAFTATAQEVTSEIECHLGEFYSTLCIKCGGAALVKYFLWVKTVPCPACGRDNDLFPGHLLAEAVRHPKQVLVCGQCGSLNEYDHQPTRANPARCTECQGPVLPFPRVCLPHPTRVSVDSFLPVCAARRDDPRTLQDMLPWRPPQRDHIYANFVGESINPQWRSPAYR
jgi:hypothetical protein